jgi:uncharacterized coiled-coil protein SlyX
MKDRIIRLEEMISLQKEDMLSMSKELYAQHKQIVQLQEQLSFLRLHMKEMSNDQKSIRRADEETQPPHY